MASHSRPFATPSPFSSFKSNTIDQEQPHLSAACIRNLVKHLSSASSTARSRAQHLHAMSSATSHDQKQPQQGHGQAPLKPQIKKQARRRMHTSKPYQERLLNMAEARREIVTALRIHRANMRQQTKYHQQEQHQPRLQQPVQLMFQEQGQAFEGVPVAMSYASSSNNHLRSSPLAILIDGFPAGNYSSSMRSYGLTPLEEAPPAVGCPNQLVCSLPAQPLGLNLSFQGFGSSVDNGKSSEDPFGYPLIQSSSCPAYSVYSSPATAVASHGSLALGGTEEYSSPPDAQTALSPVLDGDMYLIGDGERQGMEWSEAAANVAAASAWWTKIFESMESVGVGEGAGVPKKTGGQVGMADDAEAAAGLLPDWQWLCDGVRVEQEVTGPNKPDVLEMHVDDGEAEYRCCYEGGHRGNGGDIALPCVDIGDIEGWDDGEWFS